MNKKKAQRRFVFACLAPAVILVILFMVITDKRRIQWEKLLPCHLLHS